MLRLTYALHLVVTIGFLASATWAAEPAARARIAPAGVQSGDDENEDPEPDERFRPGDLKFRPRAAATRATGSGATSSGATASAATSGGGSRRLGDHPKAAEYAQRIAQAFNAREIDVVLLAGHKYMVNSCLGLKVSAGRFRLKFINPTVRIDGSGVVFETGINRIELSAIKLRMRPRVPSFDNPDPCKFSKKFEVGGKVEDLRITLRFDPLLDAERCRITEMGTPHTTVRIGNVDLRPVQNNLDQLSKNIIEDAVTYFLNVDLFSQLLQTIDDILELDCPGDPGAAGRAIQGGGSSRPGGGSVAGGTPAGGGTAGSDEALLRRLQELETRIAALEQEGAAAPSGGTGGKDAAAPDAPAGTAPAPAARGAAPATDRGTEAPPADRAAAGAGTESAAAATSPRAERPGPALARPERAATGAAFQVVPNAELKGRLGRLVVAYPKAKIDGVRVAVFRPGSKEAIATDYGNAAIELVPGTYTVEIGGRQIADVPVRSRQDTRMAVGVLRVHGAAGTRFEIFERGAKEGLQVQYGTTDIGLLVGEYDVLVRETREPVRVEAGAIVEY